MFGISIWEFLVIVLVALLVIPASQWPDVAKFLARCVKFIRNLVWKITDATEQIKERVERELPIDQIVKKTTDDMRAAFSTPLKKRGKKDKK
ncbi:MAG: twin-arginine translocase TatA/TatE family subunit [Rickettsiales bacterium]|jgi:Sec-independent protein translocase protein TatA|nr:twin-arginine translocase TatA/TatE family subunit [Rickettsiales bacterium]